MSTRCDRTSRINVGSVHRLQNRMIYYVVIVVDVIEEIVHYREVFGDGFDEVDLSNFVEGEWKFKLRIEQIA